MSFTVTPTFLIAGAQKSGTTSLYFYLDQHPDIYVSPIKEPGYFAFGPNDAWAGPGGGRFGERLVTDRKEYLALFRAGAAAAHRCEASTCYLSSTEAPRRIAEFNSDTRIILMLRDPVDRIRSAFHYLRRRELEPLGDLLQAIDSWPNRCRDGWPPYFDYLGMSSYAKHLCRYLEYFPSSQILCLKYEDFAQSPISVLREVEVFLGIPPFDGYETDIRHNPGGVSRSPMVDRVINFGGPSLRGQLRQRTPHWVHRGIARARSWNTRSAPELAPDDRARLSALLADDVFRLSEILGSKFTADWGLGQT